MKKLIAIAVVFALVMGGVFAEVGVGGYARGGVVLGQGQTGTDAISSRANGSIRLQVSGTNEEGTFGGNYRIEGSNWDGNVASTRAWVWWKPIDLFKIQLGSSGDSTFGIGDANTGWGFYGNIMTLNVWSASYDGTGFGNSVGFQGNGFGDRAGMGIYLSVYPISNLELNFILPYEWTKDLVDVAERFYAEVVYKIPDIGTVKAGYQMNSGALGATPISQSAKNDYALAQAQYDLLKDVNPDLKAPTAPTAGFVNNPAGIGVSFDLSALSGMGLSLAFKLHTGFPTTNEDQNLKQTQPLDLAVGAGFTAGDFNVKFRFFGQFLGTKMTFTTGDVLEKKPATIGFGLNPNYKASGNLFVGVGFDAKIWNIGENVATGEKLENKVAWHVSPYVRYTVGPGVFKMGLNVGAPTGLEKSITWGIPLHMTYGF